MNAKLSLFLASVALSLFAQRATGLRAAEPTSQPRAWIDGTGPGWRTLGGDDFVNVNCNRDTWTWKDGTAHCTGQPVGVIRSKQSFKNFELVAQWRHQRAGGNSVEFTRA